MKKPFASIFIAFFLFIYQWPMAVASNEMVVLPAITLFAIIAPKTTAQTTQEKVDTQSTKLKNVSGSAPVKTLLSEKFENEREANLNSFSLVQHNPNYLLPISYSPNPNSISFDGIDDEQIDRFEAKYQISVKTPLWLHQDDTSGIYFGFTAVSFWQVYNDETSKPFRETNYQPEVFYQFNTDTSLAGYKFNLFRIGLNHMSNGQSGLKSRSWNRIIATALFSDENTAYYIRTWVRLPEDAKTSPLDPLGDDNPDINDYYGRVELGFGYRLGELDIATSIRNNLSLGDNRSGVEVNITYPFNKRYDLLVQLFSGYGDSLIDYNRHKQRVSIGVQIRFL